MNRSRRYFDDPSTLGVVSHRSRAGRVACLSIVALTLSGFWTIAVRASEEASVAPSKDETSGRWTLSGLLTDPRQGHTATLLPTGKVLVAGGELDEVALASAELYDPATGEWKLTGSLVEGRINHTATLLPSGKVLAAGGAGANAGRVPLASAELYDPATGTWIDTRWLRNPREFHTATLLPSGKVLVTGGRISLQEQVATAEIYDPVTGTWSQTREMAAQRSLHTATLLPSGKVLVVGGNSLGSVEIYDPPSATWTTASPLRTSRLAHSATLLPSGKVLVVGGSSDLLMGEQVTTAELYDPATDTWSSTAAPSVAPAFHTATLLPSGRVLLAGGGDNRDLFLQEAEFYDPATESWISAERLNQARRRHTATLLPSGSVVFTGGKNVASNLPGTELYTPDDRTWQPAASMTGARIAHTATLLTSGDQRGRVLVEGWGGAPPELYDPAADAWIPLASTLPIHEGHSATLLPSGKVLFAGGGVEGGTRINLTEYLMNVKPQTACKWYDPATGEWSPTGSLRSPRLFHTATLLPSGEVLVAGGFQTPDDTTSTAELYDPETDRWRDVAPLTTPRMFHTATLLPSGEVLFTGGFDDGIPLSSAEIYDPKTDLWTPAGSLGFAAFLHTATLLASGKVLVVGGNIDEKRTVVFDPGTEAWSPAGELDEARLGHAATLLPSGKVLVTGGFNSAQTVESAELYDPATEQWYPAPAMVSRRGLHAATLLPSGDVLITGGGQGNPTTGFDIIDSVEVYRLEEARFARQPVVASVSDQIRYGETLSVTGSGFGGPWEASQSDSKNSAVNHPLIQLRNLEDGQVSWLSPDPLENFWDDPLTLTVSRLPAWPILSPGWHQLTVFRAGMASRSQFVEVGCGLVIDAPPRDQTAALGETATFTVATRGGRTFQWQKNEEDIPGATGSTYTTPPVTAADVGSTFRVEVDSGCTSAISGEAALIVEDAEPPTVEIITPSGAEIWLLSVPNEPSIEEAIWSMDDNTLICQVKASLLFSNDGGGAYQEAVSATWKAGETCRQPGVTVTNAKYRVPSRFPSGAPNSLYKVRIEVTDQAGNTAAAESKNPFFIVRRDNDFATLILANVERMESQAGITSEQAEAMTRTLRDLAAHRRVQGRIIDLSRRSALTKLYQEWDDDPSSIEKANRVLFADGGVHDILREHLEAFPAVEYLILVGDDRILPMARIPDRTVLFLESNYASDDPADLNASLTLEGTTVGRALAADQFLSDDPLAVREPVRPVNLREDGQLFLPDLAIGRLVETPEEIISAINIFQTQDGRLDLAIPESESDHQVQVSSYDFLIDSGKSIRERWKSVLGADPDDGTLAPVDGQLLGTDWSEPTVEDRRFVFHEHLSGNGGAPYAILNPNGHATHHELGVPGIDQIDIQGLPVLDIYGEDSCGNESELGSIEMPGSVIYAVGCHGGLPVPGSCTNDAERSLDLPQTMLAKGVMAYVANTGYGWGLLQGIGLSERLVQILTEELTRGGTVEIGDAVVRSKQRYFLEAPRFDDYDAKTTMQWTLFGFPMYQIETGIAEEKARHLDPHIVTRKITKGPSFLTRLEPGFDFSAEGVHIKWTADGDQVPEDVVGCPSPDGCYFTLNGLSTGTADLPIEPLFIFDSRLSGTSQHGVLWKGGTYTLEDNWQPLIAELVSNGGNGSNHGSTPRRVYIRPRGPRQRRSLGGDTEGCPASDRELNSVVFTTGEAVKNEDGNGWHHALHQRVDMEGLYFNNSFDPRENCDRRGPTLGAGPYHQVRGTTLHWAVPASDEAGVWRVVVVYTDGTLDASGHGHWIPLELADDGNGIWRGSLRVTEPSRLTYFLQVVDQRGNVTWLEYESPPSEGPASGVELGIPRPVEVELTPGTADLAIELESTPEPVRAGDPLLYTIRVSNLGPEPASSLVMVGTLSSEVVLAGATGWTCGTEGEERRAILCTLDLLEPGSVSEISMLVLAPSRETMLTAAVSVSASDADRNDDNNTASQTARVVP